VDSHGGLTPRRCDCCAEADLVPFSDLGEVPVETGTHFATEDEAIASPLGRVILGYCPSCAYVRNLAFDESLIDPAAPTDMNLYHSATFRAFCSQVVADLSTRYALAGRRVLEIGSAQGEFLRELCAVAGCTGIGYDASYAGPEGPDPSGADLRRGPAPLDGDLPAFDFLVSRFVLEHLTDPYGFLLRLRKRVGDRRVAGHLQVPDAGYDLATAGWELIYPHVSAFNASALHRIATRAGWRVTAVGQCFSGLIAYLEVSSDGDEAVGDMDVTPLRDRHLAAIRGFDRRHHAQRRRWRDTIARLADKGARPVLWGAGSRGVQLLNLADPDRRFAAVVDVNPSKWGRYLPGTGHRVDDPACLVGLGTSAVVITNPAYRTEIEKSLADMGVSATVLVA
jgi:hypothetical protein